MSILSDFGIGANRSSLPVTCHTQPPQTFPIAELGRIDFTTADADKYFWYGWNEGAPDARWTEKKAALVFAVGQLATRIIAGFYDALSCSGQIRKPASSCAFE